MPFRTDGSTHSKGVKNEENTLQIMKNLGLVSKDAHLKGGTKNKADFVDGAQKYSAKHKDLLTQGSFDWVNTSRIDYIREAYFGEFFDNVKRILASGEQISEAVIDQVRHNFEEATMSCLENCSSGDLVKFLEESFVVPNRGMKCVVTESASRRLFVFEFENHPAVKLLRENWKPVLLNVAKSSAKIYFEKDGEKVDSGLRLRVVSNNGIGAFLGVKKDKNGRKKYSTIVAKLQQDAVQKLIAAVQPEVYSF